MKKGWKRFWVFCGVTAAVGCVCAVTGKAMGATGVLVDNYMPQFFWKSGSTSVDSDQVELFSNVKNLKVDTEGLFVNIVPCEENNVRVETYNVNSRLKLQIKEEQGELKVETTAEHYPWKLLNQEVAGEVTIQVPYYLEFGEADLQVGYGELDVEDKGQRSESGSWGRSRKYQFFYSRHGGIYGRRRKSDCSGRGWKKSGYRMRSRRIKLYCRRDEGRLQLFH